MILFNDFKRQYEFLESAIKTAVGEVFESGYFILGKKVEKFEKEFSEYLGVKYAVGVGSGYDAIQISLLALGIGHGDEVITTPLSAAATALAIQAVGALPVFVDVDDYLSIDSEKIEEKITEKTKAILPVHLYGNPADIKKIYGICQKNNIFLIEDAAQAHGAMYESQKLGTFGILNCFSFYPTKNLGCFGDGGMIVTDDEELYEKCKIIRNGGQKSRYEHVLFGIDSRLDEIQAALLSVQLVYLDEYNKKRFHLAEIYMKLLRDIPQVKCTSARENSISNYHLFVIELDDRDALSSYLRECNIPTLIHYPIPIHKQKCFSEFNTLILPYVEEKVKGILSLPIHPFLKDEEVEYVCEKIESFYQKEQ